MLGKTRTFLVIVVALSWVKEVFQDTTAPPDKYLSDDLDIISLGLPVSSMQGEDIIVQCTSLCAKHNNLSNSAFVYSGVMNGLCFCGNDLQRLLGTGDCQVPSAMECPVQGFGSSVTPNTRAVLMHNISSSFIGQPLENKMTYDVAAQIKTGSSSTDLYEVYIDANGRKDDFMAYQRCDINPCMITYLNPGVYFAEFGIKYDDNQPNPIPVEIITADVHSSIQGVKFTAPSHIEIDATGAQQDFNVTLTIEGGTNITVDIITDKNKQWKMQAIDVPSNFHEITSADANELSSLNPGDQGGPDIIFTKEDYVMTTNCLLQNITLHAERAGLMKIFIYNRESCNTCEFGFNACTCYSDLLIDTTLKGEIYSTINWKVVDDFDINIPDVGIQTIVVNKELFKGDVLAIRATLTTGGAVYVNNLEKTTLYFVTDDNNIKSIVQGSPLFAIITSIPFVHNLPFISNFASSLQMNPGDNLKLSVDVDNPLQMDPVKETKIIPVVRLITTLTFPNLLTFFVNVISNIEVSTDGYPVIFSYNATESQLSTNGTDEKKGLSYTEPMITSTFEVLFNKTGYYNVSISAAYINMMETVARVFVDIPITLHELEIIPLFVAGSNVTINITIVGGIDVNATLTSSAFQQPHEWLIDTSSPNGFTITIYKIFPVCGEFLVESYAREKSGTEYTSKVNKTVLVACAIGELKVTTSPSDMVDGVLVISKFDKLTLTIVLTSGSFSKYFVSWGDGAVSSEDQSTLEVPQSFDVSYKYPTGNYSINVTAITLIGGGVKTIMLNVSVLMCVMPKLSFNYGTSLVPVIYQRADNILLTGTWKYPSLCKDMIYPNFKVKQWDLRDEQNESLLNRTDLKTEDLDHHKATYMINKLTLPAGKYHIFLSMQYKDKVTDYIGYLNIMESPLVAEIVNSVFQSIPFQQYKPDGNLTFYDFTIDGSISYDPDDIDAGVDGMIFTWECRVVSDELFVNNTINARKALNTTYYEPDACLSRNWTLASPSVSSRIGFNTEMFLEGINYDIQLTVRKSLRWKLFKQTIHIARGAPPKIELTCFKCGEKLNTMDRTILKYACPTCPKQKRLDAKWDVYRDGETPWTDKSRTTTGFVNPNLVIRTSMLAENGNYTFKLTIGYVGSLDRSIYIVQKKTSMSPTGGRCNVSPRKGTITDKFSISCSDWTTLDLPIIYKFRYDRQEEVQSSLSSTSGDNYPTLNVNSPNLPQSIDKTLPVGLKSKNYILKMKLKILNKYGQYVEYPDINVQVNPLNITNVLVETTPNGNSNEPKNETESDKLQGLLGSFNADDPTDPEQVKAIVMLKTSILETDKEGDKEKEALLPKTDNTYNIPYEKNEEELKFEKEKKKLRREENQKMLQDIANVPITNLEGLKSISEAIAVTTTNPEDVNPAAEIIASSVLMKAADSLTKMSASAGAEIIDQATKPMFAALSNLLASESEEMKETASSVSGESASGKDNGTQSKENQTMASIERVKKLVNTIEKVCGAISSNLVAGEDPTEGSTKIFDFNVQKSLPIDIPGKNVSQEFKLPMGGLFDNGNIPSGDINIQAVTYKENIFVDGKTSQHVSSKVSSLELNTGTEKLVFNDTKEPFVITLENYPSKLTARNITSYMPGKSTFETIKMDSMSCNLMLSIDLVNDFLNKTELHVLVQYGKAPTEDEHDIKLVISNNAPATIAQATGVVNVTLANNTNNNNNTGQSPQLQRSSYIKQLEGNSFLLWNFTEFTHGYLNNSEVFISMYYEGDMPPLVKISNRYTFDVFDERGAYNFSLKSFCVDCSYWNEKQFKWTKDGCQLQPQNSTLSKTVCHCNHLTAFGSFAVAPNPLPTPSLALLKEGYVLLVTVASLLLLYVVGLVFARRADITDKEKVAVLPLIDNQPTDKYLYEVIVNTGARRNAGTTSNIYITVTGERFDTGVRRLKNKDIHPFPRASTFVFIMSTEERLGDISYIRLWHDNSDNDGWYFRNVEIVDLVTEKKYIFLGGRWLAVDQADGQVECVIPAASGEDLQDFNYIFAKHSKDKLSDSHIWFSIYAKPPNSPFTRCQRLSVAMSLLFSVMLANVMFYGAVPPATPETENNVQGFKFTWQQVFVAIIGVLITVPVNIILVALFSSVRTKKFIKNGANDRVVEMEMQPPANDAESNFDAESLSSTSPFIRDQEEKTQSGKKNKDGKTDKKKKKKFQLPYWVIYPTWVLCILVIFGCGFMVVWYGMAFGNQKSLEWLSSVTIGLVQDILLIQPIKVFIVAVFVAVVIKKLEEEERGDIDKEVESLGMNKNWLRDNVHDNSGLFDRNNTDNLLPPSSSKLGVMRTLRYKEKQLQAISKEILLYLTFTGIAAVLGYSLRDYQAYYQTKDIVKTFKLGAGDTFRLASTQEKVWKYLEKILIHELFPSKWYDLDKKHENETFYDFPGFMYLNDVASKIVTGARIRQLRVKKHSCKKAEILEDAVKIDCANHYGFREEEDNDYNYDWSTKKDYTGNINPLDMPWRFQEASNLDGFPIESEIRMYYGGGYVVEMFPKWDNKAVLETLKEKRWLDRHSRALVIEFAVFNGGTNYFDAVTIIFEFPPWGGVVSYSTVTTFKLYVATSSHAFFVFIAQIMFLVFTLIFVVREARVIYKQRLKYFLEFWNLVEFSNIILSFAVIVFFFWRSLIGKDISSRLPGKTPDKYINLQFASMLDLNMTYAFALICFCVTLKFIKLLRFNKRISMLSTTLKRAWYPLMMFGISYGVILIACTIFSMMAFGRHLYEYRDMFTAFTSVIGLLLGKFSYYQFENTNRVLGPLFFFGFNIFVNWIVMNMYISILNDVLSEVYAELESTENEFEIVDYMLDGFKDLLGMNGGGGKKMESLDQSLAEIQSPPSSPSLSSMKSVRSDATVKKNDNEKENFFFSSSTTNVKDGNDDPEFITRLCNKDNLGKIRPKCQKASEKPENLLMPTTSRLDPAYAYLFEDDELDEYDEDNFSCLCMISILSIEKDLFTRSNNADDQETERALSVIQL